MVRRAEQLHTHTHTHTHTEVPILSKLSETYILWNQYSVHMPKVSRYSLGSKIDELLVDLIQIILFASYAKKNEKLAAITKASVKLDAVKFFLQLAWKSKAMKTAHYTLLSQPLNEIGKMLGGWIKNAQKENSQLQAPLGE